LRISAIIAEYKPETRGEKEDDDRGWATKAKMKGPPPMGLASGPQIINYRQNTLAGLPTRGKNFRGSGKNQNEP
jgi:hypothetical protein